MSQTASALDLRQTFIHLANEPLVVIYKALNDFPCEYFSAASASSG
jgi:hypothetical protein